MKTMFAQIVPLAVVCSILFGYQYLSADWSEPSVAPPNGNVSMPINTGSTAQIKNGALSVDALAVFGDVAVTGTTTLNQVNAAAYCDENGVNCDGGTSSSSISIGAVTGETYGDITTAETLCKDNGFDGLWGGMDRSGSETMMCYTSSIISTP